MSNKDKAPENIPEFTLEDIMKEFGAVDADPDAPADSLGDTQIYPPVTPEVAEARQTVPEELPAEPAEATEEPESAQGPEEAPPEADAAPADTQEEAAPDPMAAATQVFTPVTLDDLLAQPEAPAEAGEAEALPPETEEIPAEAQAPDTEPKVADAAVEEEPEVLTSQNIPAPKPIPFRSRLGELKRQLVAGPEKRYYDLAEIGLGRVQMAIFLCLLVSVLCAGSTVMYAMGAIPENRLRLMVFGQILSMMISALLGCYLLMDGILDLFTGKFSLNTMLFLTLAACAADAVFCLQEYRVPCCAAFSLEMTFALWNRSLRRSTEMGQMDTLRKAVRLDSLVKVKGYFGEEDGIVRGEGRLEDFMDNYSKSTGPEKVLNIYALVSLLLCVGIAVLAGTRHGLSLAVQVFSTSMLVAIPAGAFVSQSRPAAILERRLHMLGTVLCGWKGVRKLCGKAAFPLKDEDIFPLGSTKLNGVKFYGDLEPDEVIARTASLMEEAGGGLVPVFRQLLASRDGELLGVRNFQIYGTSGFGGEVKADELCLPVTAGGVLPCGTSGRWEKK